MKKFTFKTIKPVGRYKSFSNDYHVVKFLKKNIGSIDDKYPFKIKLCVYKDDLLEDGNPNCLWKSITLKKESSSLLEAKSFLNENFEKIFKTFKLYSHEN